MCTRHLQSEIGPNAEHVRTVLITAGHVLRAPFHRLLGDREPQRRTPIVHEITPPRNPGKRGVGVGHTVDHPVSPKMPPIVVVGRALPPCTEPGVGPVDHRIRG